jgi:hypothetical protein
MSGLSCPSTKLCVALAGEDIATSTNPTVRRPAWAPTAVAYSLPPEGSFGSISCPSASLCVAVDDRGDAVTTKDPAGPGSSWKFAKVGLTGISCPSTTLCVSTNGNNYAATSTAPATGRSSWHLWQVYFPGLSQGGPSGGTAIEPTPGPYSAPLVGVKCLSTKLCIACDQAGDLVTSTDPQSTHWTVGTHDLNWLSWHGTTWCAAVDNAGDVLTTTDPAGPASAWTVRHIDGSHSITGISCPTATLCVAVDNAGDVIHGTATSASAVST